MWSWLLCGSLSYVAVVLEYTSHSIDFLKLGIEEKCDCKGRAMCNGYCKQLESQSEEFVDAMV